MKNPLNCFGCTICQNNQGVGVVRRYVCAGCVRLVPWCYGAADDMPHHCDDCWAIAHSSWWKKLFTRHWWRKLWRGTLNSDDDNSPD